MDKNTSNPTWYWLSDYKVLHVSGEDSVKLLQGQLTNDITQVTEFKGQMNALCTPQGRIQSLFYVLKGENGFLLIMTDDLVEITQTTLKKYGVFYKVNIEPSGAQILGAFGETRQNWSELHLTQTDTDCFNWGSSRFIKVTESPNEAIKENSVMQQWQFADVLDKLPQIQKDSIGEFLPHNLNLPQLKAVSFSKGCYTGQEVIARMEYKAKLKSHMRLISTDGEYILKAGSQLTDDSGSKVGQVILSVAYHGQTSALALIQDKVEKSAKLIPFDQNEPILKQV